MYTFLGTGIVMSIIQNKSNFMHIMLIFGNVSGVNGMRKWWLWIRCSIDRNIVLSSFLFQLNNYQFYLQSFSNNIGYHKILRTTIIKNKHYGVMFVRIELELELENRNRTLNLQPISPHANILVTFYRYDICGLNWRFQF